MTHIEVRGQLRGVISPFHHVGHTDQIQVVMLGCKCLQLLKMFALSLLLPGSLTLNSHLLLQIETSNHAKWAGSTRPFD